jgi:superfamily II DNA or RNA helicase
VTPSDKFIQQQAKWSEFFDSTSALPNKASGQAVDKGKAFERLTQLYLKTNPDYQTKLKEVWIAHVDLPLSIREKLKLPDGDEGIDLIAETFAGEFWAIQCKFRSDTTKALTVKELATFTNLCFTVCCNVSLAVVVHTCSKPVRKRQLLGNTTEVGLQRWLAIEDEEWRRMQAATTRPAPPPIRREPRPHQSAAIKAAQYHFVNRNEDRGKLLMPCGTGKSLTAFWIALALNPKSVVVAVPSLSLIKQSLLDWTREFVAHGEIPEWLCVCSDETTGNLEGDDFVSETYELGIDTTTSLEKISAFLRADFGKRKLVFTTYQSGRILAEAARSCGFGFDLGIMDEAHRTVGAKDKSFAHLISNENLAIKQRIFMTATERISRSGEDDVLSMDDSSTYGDCFFQLSFKQAIESDPPIISDYKILTIAVSDFQVRQLVQENRYLTTAVRPMDEREAISLAAGIALQRAFDEYGVSHAITFHRSIRVAEAFRDQQEHLGSLGPGSSAPKCFHVSSKKSTGERARLIQQFRDAPAGLITNARCLQEGVDIPAVDCVLFADPKQSVVDIVQAAGRAMRPFKGKKLGYIVIPIVVPNGMALNSFAETTEFRQVARIVTALSTQDDRIAEEFRTIENKPRGSGRIVEIVGDVPLGLKINFDEFSNEIRLKLWERVGRANWRQFSESRLYAHSLNLKSLREWNILAHQKGLPSDIPSNPHTCYQSKGWTTWGDFLGTGTIAPRLRVYRPYDLARSYVHTLKLSGQREWNELRKQKNLPDDIPAKPQRTYEGDGWVGWGDWLGTGQVAPQNRVFLPFEEARNYVRSLSLKSRSQWDAFYKAGNLPKDIPAAPQRTYADSGWIGLGDWLGTGRVADHQKVYRPFQDARDFARSLGLKRQQDWFEYMKSIGRPADIPYSPNNTYVDSGWVSYSDWLGIRNRGVNGRVFLSFEEARSYARSLKLKSWSEWRQHCKSGMLPDNIPTCPHRYYLNEGWINMADWLAYEDPTT